MNHDREQVAEVYAATFAGRLDAYVRWSDGWKAVREPLTAGVVIRAIAERVPISGYFLSPDAMTHVAAIDFDTEPGLEQSRAVGRSLWANGIPAYVEPSRRGAHLWVVSDQRLPALAWRRALRIALAWAGVEPEPKIELRPGERISADGLGSALRLPTMPHPATGKRYGLYHPADRHPLGESLGEMLLALDLAPHDAIDLAAAQYRPPRASHAASEDRPPRRASGEEEGSASEILRSLFGVANAVPGRTVRCPSHEDQEPSLSILRDDRRVICHSPSCELHNDGRGRGTFELRGIAHERRPRVHADGRGLHDAHP